MTYVLVSGENALQYPYTYSQLRTDNPHTSFPLTVDAQLLQEWNVFSVLPVQKPFVNYTKTVVEGMPVLVDNNWWQTWNIIDATQEEMSSRTALRAKEIRQLRNKELSNSDWVITYSVENNTPVPNEWLIYRNILRDLPQQEGFPWETVVPPPPNINNDNIDMRDL